MKFSPLKLKDKFSKSRFSLGLDMGSSAIKFVKLRPLKDAMELCDFSIEPAGLDLGPILKHIAESQQDTKRINLSVSGPSTITRYVNFPKMGYDEFKNALKFEAQKYIPFSLAEVNLDGHILNPDLPDNKMLVLLAAAKKDFISQRLKLAQDCGLQVNTIDIDSLALVNAFNYNYPVSDNAKHSAVALLNIGAAVTNLDILEGALPRLSRDIHVAGNNFTQKLVDGLGLGFKAAEELKLNPDKERLKEITDAIEPVIANLVSEIRTSFDYFESQSSSSVAKIYLSGAGSLLAGLKDTLADLLGIEVEYWDPLRKLEICDGIDPAKVKSSSSQLAVAIGLALRS